MGLKASLLALCTAVNLYVLVASLYLALVVYPRFGTVERSAWSAAYHSFTARNGLTFVPWELLAFVLTLALYAARPASAPLWPVHVAVACGVAYFAITFGSHLPAHRAIETGGNTPDLLAPLLTSHWVRIVAELPRCAALVWMCVAAFRG